jgi:hypothetical protein
MSILSRQDRRGWKPSLWLTGFHLPGCDLPQTVLTHQIRREAMAGHLLGYLDDLQYLADLLLAAPGLVHATIQ